MEAFFKKWPCRSVETKFADFTPAPVVHAYFRSLPTIIRSWKLCSSPVTNPIQIFDDIETHTPNSLRSDLENPSMSLFDADRMLRLGFIFVSVRRKFRYNAQRFRILRPSVNWFWTTLDWAVETNKRET